ncbi:PKD domain-containing protein [Microseira wollei]|uniref:PKD domain-containing protein n=1 Tax=Microseira wollei NIES-4236 TaxID=2530354 RepID=A0AAV3XMP1_9CYAN|nr:PKD domain-containing protein [Microseira wollei]GET42913.1 hypothetical protein MiSe_77310 [Microseira wollei NIES-4236]
MTTISKFLMITAGATLMTLANVSATQAATLGGSLYFTGGNITVQVLGGEAGLTSYLSLYSPENRYIATNREVGKVVNLGNLPRGAELIFGILAEGNTFLMGPGSRNPDGIPHAVVNFVAPGIADVGFEDLFRGGDRDYDDNNFRFTGGIAAAPPPPVPPIITSLTSDLTIPIHHLFDFAATATDADWGDILTYLWDFDGDGNYDDFTGTSGRWSFDRPGDHKVSLRVVDRYGLYADGSFNVKAVPEPASVFGLLAFGAFGVSSLLKRKQQQKVLNSVATD